MVDVCSEVDTSLESNSTVSEESSPAQPCGWHCQQVHGHPTAPHSPLQCGCQDNHSTDCVQKLESEQCLIQPLAPHPKMHPVSGLNNFDVIYKRQVFKKRSIPIDILLISSKVQIL